MKFRESRMAHSLLDGLTGIEIGGSAHNSFGLANCLNVDFTDDMNTIFKLEEERMCGEKLPVDVVSPGDRLPLDDGSLDYVISSHVLEHLFDPIRAIKEWFRVIREDGYIYMIIPKPDAIPTEDRPPTSLQELLDRHEGRMKPSEVYPGAGQPQPVDESWYGHWTVFDPESFWALCGHFGWTVAAFQRTDDKVGNGFCFVLTKVS